MNLARTSLLRSLLVAIATAPAAAGCGGQTTDDLGTTSTGGAGGSTAGGSSGGQAGQPGGGGTTQAGSGGAVQAGSGGAVQAGAGGVVQGGTTQAGSGGFEPAGAGGAIQGGSAGTGGVVQGGSAPIGGQAGMVNGGTAGTTSGGAAGTTSGGAAGHAEVPCDNPMPVLVNGQETGFVTCANGALTRPEARACVDNIKPTTMCPGPTGGPGGCTTNADCKAGPHGVCQGSFGGCQCVYGCEQDSDCAADEICQCGEQIGFCTKATCRTDADCPEGGCALFEAGLPGCGSQQFACQQLADKCASNQQCQDSQQFGLCHIESPGEPRECVPVSCAVGRPLVVAERLRHAGLVLTGAWG